MKWLAGVIVLLGVLYGFAVGAQKHDLIFYPFGGLIAGLIVVGLLLVVLWLARIFRTKAPKGALYTGTVFYWIGTGVAVFALGLGAWSAYAVSSIKFVLYGVGLAIFYWALGWGIR